jgi:hypothetical protein
MSSDKFIADMNKAYQFEGESFALGGAMLDKKAISGVLVNIALSTLNRHGLVTGATGTGKTKSLQYLCEQLSLTWIASVMMDVKWDVSWLAKAGEINDKIETRMKNIGLERKAQGFPVELLTLSNSNGVRMRSTVSEMGPILMAKLLDLNDTQSAVLAIIFKYCDEHNLLLVDLEDLKKTLNYMGTINDEAFKTEYGSISDASLSVIMRSVLELEGQGGAQCFGEPSLEIKDLMRKSWEQGVINILQSYDIFTKPKLYSTFILGLLAECFNTLPEVGDLPAPKLVIIIDEAHLLFQDLDKQILNHISMIIKLIRSRGVSIIFCTQSPTDIPEGILGQLGLKIQHALRAFTPKDVKGIRLIEETFPITSFYDVENLITELGTGEALVTCIDENGYPSPLVHTLIATPSSRMGSLDENEYSQIISNSLLVSKYEKTIDPESASEILIRKIEDQQEDKDKSKWFFWRIFDNQIVKTTSTYAIKEIARGALGKLGAKGTTKTAGANLITNLFGKLIK